MTKEEIKEAIGEAGLEVISMEEMGVMFKRGEIEELIEKYISLAYWYEGRKNIVKSLTKGLITRLDKKGVVIKVERELPAYGCKYSCDWNEGYNTCVDERAGYEATIPLKEE